jgi:hypothetical protein
MSSRRPGCGRVMDTGPLRSKGRPGNPCGNFDTEGRAYPQAEAAALSASPEPMHELANVLRQLGDNAWSPRPRAYTRTPGARPTGEGRPPACPKSKRVWAGCGCPLLI